MGATIMLFCISQLTVDNWIDIISLIVNSILAGWVINVIQKNLANKRVLKDHFIGEVKETQMMYREYFKLVESGNLRESSVIPWFKSMNIRVADLMAQLNDHYKVDVNSLHAFQVDLRDMTTDSSEYIQLFRSGTAITFGTATLNSFLQFQQQHMKSFNKLIIKINNH